MRNHRSPTLARLMPCVLACACLQGAARGAVAETHALWGFGDSLLDTGRVCARTGFPSGEYGTCSDGKGTLQWLPDYAPFAFDRATNLAEGGAGTGVFNVATLIIPGAAGAQTQVARFVAAGGRISAGDLVLYSAGPNNRFLIGALGPLFGQLYEAGLSGEGLAARSLEETRANIAALIDAGARNIVVFGGRARTVAGSPEQRYFAAMNNGLQDALGGFARDGTRLRIFDFQTLYARAIVDPRRFGLEQPFLYSDNTHPSTGGHRLFAQYIATLARSADGIAAQADLAEADTLAFSEALFDRLQTLRSVSAYTPPGFGAYLQPLAARGSRADFVSAAGTAAGVDYAVDGLVGGIEYRQGAQTRYGVALGYAEADADLDDAAGSTDGTTLNASVYLAHDAGALSLDAALAYADHDLDIERPGVVDSLTADTGGHTAFAGLHASWLFRYAELAIGPLLTLDYSDSQVGGYTESGDDLLAQRVAGQDLDSLELGAGIRLRATLRLAGRPFEPALDMSVVNDVLADDRGIRTANVFAPSLPVHTLIDDDQREGSFVRLSAGARLRLTPALGLMLAARARLPGDGAREFGATASLELALP
jgi:outer membrane autotransporter protein